MNIIGVALSVLCLIGMLWLILTTETPEGPHKRFLNRVLEIFALAFLALYFLGLAFLFALD